MSSGRLHRLRIGVIASRGGRLRQADPPFVYELVPVGGFEGAIVAGR